MSLFSNIRRRLGLYTAEEALSMIAQKSSSSWLADLAEYEKHSSDFPDPALYENQARLYQKLSWIATAVSIVADTASGAELNVLERKGQDTVNIPHHPLEERLRAPNEMDSRKEFLGATVAYYKLTGNAYWWLNSPAEGKPPSEMWIIPTHMIKPVPDGRMYLKGYEYDSGTGGRPILLPPWQIVHFKTFNPFSRFVGMSPIEAAANQAVADLKRAEWDANLFAKENAKLPGALAFSDMVRDGPWEKMKKEIRQNWGGAKRGGPLMLRGVGQGGVKWVQMALSQSDMEFLESRRFARDEIYGLFAPGLASILEVNATEANALAAKETYLEYAVWPALVTIAEKITQKILPLYGKGQIAKFEDVRKTDRAVILKELEAYERTHTVDEVRVEKYGDAPLKDERGNMFPIQIKPAGLFSVNDPGDQPKEKEKNLDYRREKQQNRVMPEPIKADREILDELRRWERKARKRVGRECPFVSDILPAGLMVEIEGALKACETEDEIKHVFAEARASLDPADALIVLRGLEATVEAIKSGKY